MVILYEFASLGLLEGEKSTVFEVEDLRLIRFGVLLAGE